MRRTKSVHRQLLCGPDGDFPGLLHLERVHFFRRWGLSGCLGRLCALLTRQRSRVARGVGQRGILWLGGGRGVQVQHPLRGRRRDDRHSEGAMEQSSDSMGGGVHVNYVDNQCVDAGSQCSVVLSELAVPLGASTFPPPHDLRAVSSGLASRRSASNSIRPIFTSPVCSPPASAPHDMRSTT